MNTKNYSRHVYGILMCLAIIIGACLLYVTEAFVLPVIISVLMAFVFYPIVKKLTTKFKMPWVVSVIVTVILLVIAILLIFTFFYASALTMMDQYNKYEERFLYLYKMCADAFNLPFSDDKTFFENLWGQLKVREFVQNIAISASNGVISFGKTLVTILLFMTFLLIEMKNGNDKVKAMFKGKLQERVHRIISKTITDVVHYISIKFFISLATAVLVFLVLLMVRVDFAIMWAFFAFVMNFIPTFGSILSVVLTSLFALLQFYPSPIPVIVTLVGMTSINMILGNILEPRIEGKNLDLSPFVILVSLTFWGWMWGFIGMILAVPVMVILKIVCENFKFLHPLAILIGNKTEDTVKELYSTDDEDDDAENNVQKTEIKSEQKTESSEK